MSSLTTTVEAGFSTPTTPPNKNTANNRGELAFWIGLLILANLGLFIGNTPSVELTFRPEAVAAGEWWRLLISPFVHVSRYHLLMDGTAFLLVYAGLEERRGSRRLALALCSAAGSLLLPLALAPELNQIGLCGLSGAAHGLTAVSALEMLQHREQKKIGVILLVALMLKTAWEMWSGSVFLQFLHFGNIGQPIVATHAGGVIGGMLGFLLIDFVGKKLKCEMRTNDEGGANETAEQQSIRPNRISSSSATRWYGRHQAPEQPVCGSLHSD